MVNKTPRRTLNRINAIINCMSSVAKTIAIMLDVDKHQTDNLSWQLLAPAEQSDENEIVTLDRKNDSVMGQVKLANLDAQGICPHAHDDLSTEDDNEQLINPQSIHEAIDSADSTLEGLTRSALWSLSNLQIFANADGRVADRFVHATLDNSKSSLNSLLAEKSGSVATRFAFPINHPPNAILHPISYMADMTIPSNKLGCLSKTMVDRYTTDVQKAQMVGIEIKIHISTPASLVNQQRYDKSMQKPSKEWYRASTVSATVLRDRKVAEVTSNDIEIFKRSEWREFPATNVYKTLVERINDG